MSDGGAFADWFRAELRRRQWSLSDLSRRLRQVRGDGEPAPAPSVVSRWARGLRPPSPEPIKLVGEVFGADVDRLLTLAGHRSATEELVADDPRSRVVTLVKRTRLDEERALALEVLLRQWNELDQKRAATNATG